MNYYEIIFVVSYGFNAFVLFFLALFVFIKNPRSIINTTYSFYSFSIAWWSFFSIFMINSPTQLGATFWDRICLIGVIFIPTTFFHFTCAFLQLKAFKKVKHPQRMLSFNDAFSKEDITDWQERFSKLLTENR